MPTTKSCGCQYPFELTKGCVYSLQHRVWVLFLPPYCSYSSLLQPSECGHRSALAVCGSMLTSPGLQSHFTMMVQLCHSSASTLNYAVVSKYGKVLTQKIYALIWFDMKKRKKSLMEDKRKYKAWREHTCWNSKRHISLVNLLLWCKIVAVCCFV